MFWWGIQNIREEDRLSRMSLNEMRPIKRQLDTSHACI